MSSAESISFTPDERRALLDLAQSSIREGIRGRRLAIELDTLPGALRAPGASFVTLHVREELRGCIGSLEARVSLAEDVIANSWNAAFRDTRFPKMTEREFERVEIHISVLTPPQPMQFSSEADLLGQLRPGVDGLVIEEHYRRGTFLPAVWSQLPDPRQFLRQLKQKAGLAADHWSADIRVSRYTTIAIP